MIYVFVSLPLAFFITYCLASVFSVYSLSIATIAIAAGVAAFSLRRTSILGVCVAASVILYLSTVFSEAGSYRIVKGLVLGSALFLSADWGHDLIILRMRRIPLRAFSRRIHIALKVVVITAVMGMVVSVLGANALYYIPEIAGIRVGIPAISFLVAIYALYVFFRTR
jgi:hypothetical protein